MSLIGKILILKSLVLPQINYLLSVCFCPMHMLKKMDRLLFKFLWENKPAKIKINTFTATYTMGGLKIPAIFAINVVSKIKWTKQLLMESQGKWQCLTWYLLNIAEGKLQNKFPPTQRFKCLTLFTGC